MNFPVEHDEWIEDLQAPGDENVDRDMYGLQPFYPAPAVGRNAMPESWSEPRSESWSEPSRESLETLDVLFRRYRPLLSLIAHRVLGNHEQAEQAVRNCLRAASGNTPRFEQEGAFRSWLARVLIDEAVTILHKQRSVPMRLPPYCRNAKAASVMAVTPVRRVGSGSGAKKGECGEGSATPVRSLLATFAGS